ncbi:MAG: hypothetical protein ACTHKK_03540 [Candidatus Nitrosocosmicus sp.]
MIPKNNQPRSIINSQYTQFGFKASVEGLTCSINQSIKDIVFETNSKFCKSNLVYPSSKSNHNIIDESMKSRVNNNDSMMTVTYYHYIRGTV